MYVDGMTHDQVIEVLQGMVIQAGSQYQLAKQLNTSVTYLSFVLNRKCAPGPSILNELGLTKEIRYVPSSQKLKQRSKNKPSLRDGATES